ncbi:MAG TPA: hypothetical protein VGF95_15110 [Solirubrobacteraceae bacterium]
MTGIPWTQSDPEHLLAERAQVGALAPELRWTEKLSYRARDGLAGFEGLLPAWCAPRPEPPGIGELLAGARLMLRCIYTQATPMIPPVIFPLELEIPLARRTDHAWHLNGDGSLCLLRAAADWCPGETAVPLLVKASCWFIEYHLKDRGLIEKMTDSGIACDESLDSMLGSLGC